MSKSILPAMCMLLLAAVAWAQFSSGFQGTVTDRSSGVVPGVVIRVMNTETGVQREVVSSESGVYVVPSLNPGIYTLEALKDVGCHMARRPAQDGGHTVFTDHRIRKKPDAADERGNGTEDLRAWRPPEPKLQARNLGLAYVNAGLADRSPAEVARGYRMLAEFQPSAPDDREVLKGIGHAVLAAGYPAQALKAFEWALKLAPGSATSEEELGAALLQSGQLENAASHLERALNLDPLLLSAGTSLQQVYRRQGNSGKADALAERMRRTMLGLSH
jgi:tetratricopeptide (TPR) repeat protein